MKLVLAAFLTLSVNISVFAATPVTDNKSKTIVFIHGMFMNPKSWDNWTKYFEDKGYKTYAPAWPYHEGNPRLLKMKVDPKLGKLTFKQVYDSLNEYIAQLPEKPILIGHSMGGLLAQKLLANNKGVAAVVIDSAPPEGISSSEGSFVKSNLPVINPLAGDSIFLMDNNHFQYTFTNNMTKQETQKVLNNYVVPESRNVARTSTGDDGYIDLNAPHKPILFIAGEKDNILPASLIKTNFAAYKDQNSVTDFKEFSDRTHYICGQPGWEEVAEYSNNWLNTLK